MNCFDPLMDDGGALFPPPPPSDSIPDLLQVRHLFWTFWRDIQINFFQNGQQQHEQQQPPLPKDQLHFRSLTRAGHLPPPPPPVPRDILAVYAKRDPKSERKMAGSSNNPQRLPSSPLIVNMPAGVRNRSEVPRV